MVGADKKYGEVQSARQRIIKEQRIFEVIIEILDSVLKQDYEVKLLKEIMNENQDQKYIDTNESESLKVARIKYIIGIVQHIYSFLITLCHKNIENQRYAFSYLRVFVKHVECNLGATKFLLSMLKNNEELLLGVHDVQLPNAYFCKKMPDNDIISYYTSLLCLQKHSKKPQLLDFLKVICTSQGNRIKVNQEKIFELVFLNREIYESTIIAISIKGSELYIETEAETALSAYFEDGHVVLDEVLMNYFTKLLELFGCLCVGRNYLCIDSLKETFPGHILQKIM